MQRGEVPPGMSEHNVLPLLYRVLPIDCAEKLVEDLTCTAVDEVMNRVKS